jgi:molecular chaperone DnaK (HSP70)
MNFDDYKQKIKIHGMSEEEYIVGIDLGTTHSVISYWNRSKNTAEPIDMSNGFGKIPMPSVVQFRKEELDEEWIVGEEALNSCVIYPTTTIQSIKTLMGSDEKVTIGIQSYLPEEISAMILKTLLAQIKSINPKSVCIGVVVSVPYDFDDAAKKATIRACHLAGLGDNFISLIEEPKAAALAYNNTHPFKANEVLLVFDFGGGTLDITLFQVQAINEKTQTLKVLSEGGEAKHGGDLIDQLVLEHFLRELEKLGISRSSLSPENYSELAVRSKETKERLSGANKVRVPFGFCNPPFILPFTRKEFELIIIDFIEKTKNLIYRSLQDAYKGAIKPEEVDKILLEGGSSQMPWVKELMIHIFQRS